MPEERKFNLENALSEGFDKMVADAGEKPEETVEVTEEITDGTEVEVSAEETEERIEEVETEQDEEEIDASAEVDNEPLPEEEPEYDEPAPERWTAEMKEAYEKIPPEARKLMVESVFKPMQRQYTETTTELSKMKEQVAPVLKIMEEYSGAFSGEDANPVAELRRQSAWAAHFKKVGVEQGMADMSKSFGVKDVSDGQVQEEYLTPVERKLKSELASVKGELNQQREASKKTDENAQRSAQQQHYQRVHGELRSFIDEQKDGKTLHPHVEKVAPQIAGLLKSGLVTQVDEYGQRVPYRDQFAQAYKMACDMNPALRSAVTPNSRQRQVDKAKAAQDVGVVATMSSKHEVRPELSVADAVGAAFDQLERRSG